MRAITTERPRVFEPIVQAVGELPDISLEDVNAKAELQDRVDTKFIVTPDVLLALIDHLDGQLEVLSIGGRSSFSYDSTYFDTPELTTYRQHLQGRRRRYKIRTRTYVDSAFSVLEVKTKGLRGRTQKVRCEHDGDPQTLDTAARSYVRGVLEDYGIAGADALARQLEPTLRTTYRRTTLVGKHRPFRITCDARLGCADHEHAVTTLTDRILLETKTGGERDPLILTLRKLGARPVKVSKYCAGIGMVKSEVPAQPWNPVIKRHLRPVS